MINKKVELLAPAGNFMSAVYSFKAGADSVYLGLKNFSARKSAQNFTEEELLKLKKIAFSENKKIYITINTIIKESEINLLIRNLWFLDFIQVDAIIVQDIGTIDIIKKYFPHIPIHASTQMAIHNTCGIKKAKELGLKRIILPRELTIGEVRDLRSKNMDIELEIFIHGALCYSYSGLCLASGVMLGRSGNRGECAQLCRNYYFFEKNKGFFLSCKDLYSGKKVIELVKTGVDSLKIEGRMKTPEYVYNVVKLYRYIIDHADNLCESSYLELLMNSEFVFSRTKTQGYLFSGKKENIIDSSYPRHKGSLIGRVNNVSNNSFSFFTKARIMVHDVLMYFNDTSEPHKIPVKKFLNNGNLVFETDKNSNITMYCENPPRVDQEIYKTYSKDLELKGIRHKSFKTFKSIIPIEVILTNEKKTSLLFTFSFKNKTYSKGFNCVFEKAKKTSDFKIHLEKKIKESDQYIFELEIIRFINKTNINNNDIYIQGCLLKKIKNDLYIHIDSILKTDLSETINLINSHNQTTPVSNSNISNPFNKNFYEFIKKRENLNFNGMPFYLGGEIKPDLMNSFGGIYFLPLKPISYDSENYYCDIEDFIKNMGNKILILGMNNLCHLKLMEDFQKFDNIYWFVDFFIYIANSFAVNTIKKYSNKVLFGYLWIEDMSNEAQELKTTFPLFRVGSSFNPPIFMHEGSFKIENNFSQFNNKEVIIENNKNFFKILTEKNWSFIFNKFP